MAKPSCVGRFSLCELRASVVSLNAEFRMKLEQEIFEQAIALLSREAREGFLLGACGQNRELRRSVDELLAAFDDAGKLDFLQTTDRSQEAQTVPAETPLDEGPGTVIGRRRGATR